MRVPELAVRAVQQLPLQRELRGGIGQLVAVLAAKPNSDRHQRRPRIACEDARRLLLVILSPPLD
jgi:hypothetical protein